MGAFLWHSTPLSANYRNKLLNSLDPKVHFRVYTGDILFLQGKSPV